MTAEQLQAARAAHWRQSQNPVLTLEDAAEWFSRHPLSLYLSRRAQLPAPAPSFVEACLGKASAEPPQAAIEQATGFLARLAAADSVIALNLLGAPAEQPDFLAHREVLPFLVSLRGERDWKHAPGSSAIHKASPLVVELWKALEHAGPLTAAGLRETLGRELTESAVVRGLSELWQSLRAIPVLQPQGQPAVWELLETRHGDAIAQGSSGSQVTAISLLVSMYLQSVYAASGEEIEIFLSPLVSRSRIREAVRGLSATRQIHSLSMDTETYYFLEEGLPKFAEGEPERPKIVMPRRPSVEKPRRPGSGAPEWAKRGQFKRAQEIAAAQVARPQPPQPKAARPGAEKKFVPRSRPDRGDYPRRKDAKPAYGKRSGSGQRNGRGHPARQGIAEGHHGREGSPQRQVASDTGRPAARTKQRWRNTPGKPGYQPKRAPSPGVAPRRPTQERKFSSPAYGLPGSGGFRTGKPRNGKPGAGEASSGRPNAGRSNAGRPNASRPGSGRPGAGQRRTTTTGRPPSAWGVKAERPPRSKPPFAASLGSGGRPARGKRNFQGGDPGRKDRGRKDRGSEIPGKKKPEA